MTDVRDLLQEAVGSYRPRGNERRVERRVERRRRAQRVSAAVVGLGVFAMVGWLGWAVLRPVDGVPGSTPTLTSPATGPPVVGPAEDGDRAEVVPLGDLPERGVAVGSGDVVELVALDGSVLARLTGYAIAGNPGAPGVWLERDDQLYALNLEEGALVPVSAGGAGDAIYDEGTEPALAPPSMRPKEDVIPAGRWRYVIEGPDATLAQWSGECEVPTAFWIQGSETPIVTGEGRLEHSPASLALGWSEEGMAIVLVHNAPCGGDIDRSGIYLYPSPGGGRLIHRVSDPVLAADAWGTGLGAT